MIGALSLIKSNEACITCRVLVYTVEELKSPT